MRRRSNQRITKIKKDFIEELLKKAEGMNVEDGTSIQPVGSDLIPYPDMNNLRLWTRDYLLKGLTKVYPVKIDEEGQTYLTTLIDGLPLFTKLTKTLSVTEANFTPHIVDFITPVGDVTIGNTGIVGNFSANNYLKLNKDAFQIGDTLQLKFTTGSSITDRNQDLFTTNPVTAGPGLFVYNGAINQQIFSKTVIIPSGTLQTNSTFWIRLTRTGQTTFTYSYSTNSTNFTGGSGTDNWSGDIVEYIIGCRNGGSDFFEGTIDLAGSNITRGTTVYPFWITEPQSIQVETSKPGLWLSNLVAPISNSSSGSWLRHNFIHTPGDFNNVNSDIIGNYSWSFLQRGILHRTAGSTHADSDSYCQHWSPSALSCISHDAIIIPTNNLRSTYTSYQSLVVPSNPDMQRYSETLSKDVSYNFVDNNNNIPLSITQFNGRVVGKDWSYELIFTPNHSGSSGDPSNNDSSGGCTTGTITYYDPITDITCTQDINSCFETTQGLFNPDLPHNDDNQILDISQVKVSTTYIKFFTCCPNGYKAGGDYPYTGNVYASVTGSGVELTMPNDDGTYYISYDASASATCGDKGFTGVIKPSCSSGWCADNCGDAILRTTNKNVKVPETNVNIYMNIKDNKAEFEANGLPWTGSCSEPRFEINYSTSPCTASYCTSKVIAQNVDISSSGFISNLTSQNLKG